MTSQVSIQSRLSGICRRMCRITVIACVPYGAGCATPPGECVRYENVYTNETVSMRGYGTVVLQRKNTVCVERVGGVM